MPNNHFTFKRFTIHQEHCAMKVSTDACLLGAWAGPEAESILDIGTGTGVLSLMLAQRFSHSLIDAVETDEEAAAQAKENAEASPFADRITIHHSSIQNYTSGSHVLFDLIVSNPPYFDDHLQSENNRRNMALHNDSLPFSELADCVSKLLAERGDFCLILPPVQMKKFADEAGSRGLYPVRRCTIYDKKSSKPQRQLAVFSRVPATLEEETLVLKEDDGSYTEAFRELLKDFYLHF